MSIFKCDSIKIQVDSVSTRKRNVLSPLYYSIFVDGGNWKWETLHLVPMFGFLQRLLNFF